MNAINIMDTVTIQRGVIADPRPLIAEIASLGSRFAIITHPSLAALYGKTLQNSMVSSHLDTILLTFPEGEIHKTRANKEMLEDRLLESGYGRDSCIIALGGGVVSDLAGYLAATYCRGVPYVIIPTSLLGMVDAAIGGKTGVNTPYGKNMIGAVCQPKKIWIDSNLLQTLSPQEMRNGIVEIIKHGLIQDQALFDYLDTHSQQIMARDPKTLEHVIYNSCMIKMKIVQEDEKETGKRRLLNFGHTIGHALERLHEFTVPHGEAVAIGLAVESYIATLLKTLDFSAHEQIIQILKRYQLPLRLKRAFPLEKILDAMMMDKKSLKGQPRFVMIDAIGSACPFHGAYCTPVDPAVIKQGLEWMNHVMCRH